MVVIGAGAAGLMAALVARGSVGADGGERPVPSDAPSVLVLEGSSRLGLKILISGGGRCNVCNVSASEHDFVTDRSFALRAMLREFPAAWLRTFFECRGLELEEEPIGKLFPRTQKARDVLDLLLHSLRESGARLRSGAEVNEIVRPPDQDRWTVQGNGFEPVAGRTVILATGGKSLPKTGSRGFGFALAQKLGIEMEEPVPALTPILLSDESLLQSLAGLTLPVLLSLSPADTPEDQVAGARFSPLARAAGSLLVTHHGVSGPAALDVSGAVARSLARGEAALLHADFWTLTQPDGPYREYRDLRKAPGSSLPSSLRVRPISFEAFAEDLHRVAGATTLLSGIARRIPRSLAALLLEHARLSGTALLSNLASSELKRLYRCLVHWRLPIRDTEGYAKAEVTAGGVLLAELDRRTLECRRHPGLFFCGEVVNVTGRLGGFNFQWAFTSGALAGRGAAASRSGACRGRE